MQEAKKSLGQHWLVDEQSLNSIVKFGVVSEGDNVLEIGPGKGVLTEKLIKLGANVDAVELDDNLIQFLENKFGNKINLYHQDILDFDLNVLPDNYKVIANIPYYLTGKIIRKLLNSDNKPDLIVLLIQKEVAQSIAAKPGKMSQLSVSAQLFCDVEMGEVVPAKAFHPPPKVDSQVIKLVSLGEPRLNVDLDDFFKMMNFAFSAKRKTLLNNFSNGLQIEKPDILKMLSNAGLNEKSRAQELNFEQWQKLFEEYLKLND